eukprot:3029588-Rhodomonas_salina.1
MGGDMRARAAIRCVLKAYRSGWVARSFRAVLLHTHTTVVFTGHTKAIHAIGWNNDGKRLATASGDTTARVWNIETHREGRETELKDHTEPVDGLSWCPNHSEILATASQDKMVRLWDLRGESNTSSGFFSSCFCGNSRRLGLQTARRSLAIPTPDEILNVEYSPDGNFLLTNDKVPLPLARFLSRRAASYAARLMAFLLLLAAAVAFIGCCFIGCCCARAVLTSALGQSESVRLIDVRNSKNSIVASNSFDQQYWVSTTPAQLHLHALAPRSPTPRRVTALRLPESRAQRTWPSGRGEGMRDGGERRAGVGGDRGGVS